LATAGFGVTSSTAGFLIFNDAATHIRQGHFTLALLSGTTYTASHVTSATSSPVVVWWGAGTSPSIGSAIDRIRITTVNGLDAFDAGSINILYE
jgi:hypothetical protein